MFRKGYTYSSFNLCVAESFEEDNLIVSPEFEVSFKVLMSEAFDPREEEEEQNFRGKTNKAIVDRFLDICKKYFPEVNLPEDVTFLMSLAEGNRERLVLYNPSFLDWQELSAFIQYAYILLKRIFPNTGKDREKKLSRSVLSHIAKSGIPWEQIIEADDLLDQMHWEIYGRTPISMGIWARTFLGALWSLEFLDVLMFTPGTCTFFVFLQILREFQNSRSLHWSM
jgi:hypothetical protein